MKNILGLDLGTNSIGWALINYSSENHQGNILGLGCRIIPMSQDVLGKFDSGVSISQTAERTGYRSTRKLNQRQLLRRERLHRVLNILGFLPKHYLDSIDFTKYYGQFKPETETKLVYKKDENGKYQFLFQQSFHEMLLEFKENGWENVKIPYDLTIYYLRKKALTQKIKKEELAWLILNFNQKRGYYQLRGEDLDENSKKMNKFYTLKVVDVIEGEKGKSGIWYNVVLENGWIYKRESKISLSNWIDKERDFIVTTELDDNGKVKLNKYNEEIRSFRSPKEDDWGLRKIRTEQIIEESNKEVGTFIYNTLLQNPTQKINGKLIRTIERKFYKQELEQILKKQMEFHKELQDSDLYIKCINELYKHNEAHKSNIKNRGFDYLFIEDIIFYQRPLKSKISLISDCSLEFRFYKKADQTIEKEPIKCIAKSHPLFQEFRLWQFVKNLKIIERQKVVNSITKFDEDVTNEFFKTEEDWIALYDFLNDKKDVTQKQFLAKYKLKEDKYRWNFVEDKTYPCNETRALFLTKAAKIEGMTASFFDKKNTEDLWHIQYSVNDRAEIESAIGKFTKKHNLPEEFAKEFSNLPAYKSEYGSFSAKAIKKLLPLMRMGKYWNVETIGSKTTERINKICTGEYDENIKNRVREKAINLTEINNFKGLPLWLASYIVYDKHSEGSDTTKWKNPDDISNYFKNEFKQHLLRNPIVEQVITETLRVVRDLWKYYGKGKEGFFDEIHLELGREMKNPAEKRKQITEKNSQNENTNIRIKALLEELKNDGIAEVRPYSLSQQEILKIYEEGIYLNENRKDQLDAIDKIRKNSKPTTSDILRYKLWLEQGYISPYTGEIISLGELFTTKYQIEHIFPQSRFFDDSMNNKIICESEVNSLKDNMTAYEFIKKHRGVRVDLNGGGFVNILMVDVYENHIKTYFTKNKVKQKNLLSEEIPESFINRQLNDSRYISKVIKNYLSKIVREQKEGNLEQDATSKNIVPVTGAITSKMKQDWGLNDVWNSIIIPRFERLNMLTNSTEFGQWEDKQGKKVFQTTVPNNSSKGFSKKRIDHRHHALDALVIACITKDHINYLNSINSERTNYSLVSKLRIMEEVFIKGEKKIVPKEFHKPWETFTVDAKNQLLKTVISFKQDTRIINKTINRYQKYENGKKISSKQINGENWAIRQPLHAETVSGKVFLRREKENPVLLSTALMQIEDVVDLKIKTILKRKAKELNNNVEELKKYFKKNPLTVNGKETESVKIYEIIEASATRKTLDTTFDEKRIGKITDTGIQKILMNHLRQPIYQSAIDENGKKIPANEVAFSEEGLDALSRNIQQLNNGKSHQPIKKVRVFEEGGKFALGQTGNKSNKYVEAAKGTNLFFAIYRDKNGKRCYQTIPLNEAIERQKQGIRIAPEKDKDGNQLLFTLSPNDLVYIPTADEMENLSLINFENLTKEQFFRIYKFVSCTGGEGHFVTNNYAKEIISNENGSNNKNERMLELIKSSTIYDEKEKPIMIKTVCWKLTTDRLGNLRLAKS
ncbi:type II CRISPR RNA-guided endonuclease Cas9 [Pseudarcicella hirudinis]|nr:type II CRISPR RNA-guided endonuclease Cas9 [Pseudarcicella hirudinis]